MLQTETDFGSRLCFVLTWGILNFFWIALLRRPALSGALSLTMVVVLVLLSRLKHDVAQMTVNFVDLMVIDRDTTAFLFTIFPNLRWSVIAAGPRHASPDVCAVVARSLPHPPPAGARRRARLPRRADRSIRWPIRTKPGAAITTTAISRNSRAPASPPSPISCNYGFMEADAAATDRLNVAAARFLPSRGPPAQHHHDP